MGEGECTAIVAYRVNAEDVDRFLDAWDQANDYLSEQPGFVSNALHRAVSAAPEFRFVNIARWEDEDSFRAATRSSAFAEASGRLAAYDLYAAVYEAVRT